MTNLLKATKVVVVLCLQFIIWSASVQAEVGNEPTGSFTFEALNLADIETTDQITIKVSGTTGEVSWKAKNGEIQGTGNEVIFIASGKPDTEIITVTDASGQTGTLKFDVGGFLALTLNKIIFLFVVGFVGGLVSGFIGSGGAFVLTPAMMSMGVPAIMAVASNMCHKFPKALVGSMKRAKYGQVDVKLGVVLGISAEAGVLYGASIQTQIKEAFGDVGSNLYVSFVFVVVLAVVGGYVLRDAWKIYKQSGDANAEEHKVTKLAKWVQSVNIPGTMMYFPSIGTKISVLFTIPIGFATGLLAATIAVGGFIGVPALMYVLGVPALMASATELVIAFVMGMGGTIKYAISGYVDVRLAMIILAGSLFGVQLGAIGTTYVKDFMVKVVMGVIMMLVLVSRGLKVPVYLAEIGEIDPLSPSMVSFLDITSYIMLIAALAVGAFIILYALVSGYRKHSRELATETALFVEQSKSAVTEIFPTETTQLSPIGRFERILFANDNSEFGVGAKREAIRLVQRIGGNLSIISVIVNHSANEFMAQRSFEKESQVAIEQLEVVKSQAIDAGIDCTISVYQGENITNEIISTSEEKHSDLIVIGRRGKKGLLQSMMGDRTNEIIHRSNCSVLVVPKAAEIKGKSILLAVADGSHYSDMAAVAAGKLAIHLNAPIIVLSVTSAKLKDEAEAIVARIGHFLRDDGVTVESQVVVNDKYATTIVETAKNTKSDLIVVGSQGCAERQKALLGTSVSKRVIGTAECAVLVVKT
jgi:uncharacterized membrane protein YfcA/nucleotide-binding universal stress UspA family protein